MTDEQFYRAADIRNQLADIQCILDQENLPQLISILKITFDNKDGKSEFDRYFKRVMKNIKTKLIAKQVALKKELKSI